MVERYLYFWRSSMEGREDDPRTTPVEDVREEGVKETPSKKKPQRDWGSYNAQTHFASLPERSGGEW